MHPRRAPLALCLGALCLSGCTDLDRQVLELASMAMLAILVAQTVVMVAALQSPSTSGWRTFGTVLAALVAVPGMLCAFGGALIYLRRDAWPTASTLNLAFVLYGAAALLAMAVRVATWHTAAEIAARIEAGEAPQSRAFPITGAAGMALATIAIAILLVR